MKDSAHRSPDQCSSDVAATVLAGRWYQNTTQQTARAGVDDGVSRGERADQTDPRFGGFQGRTADAGVEGRDNEQLPTLELGLPVGRKLKRVDATRRTDDDGLWSTKENAQTFLLDRRVEAADGGAILGTPALGKVHRFKNLGAGTGARTEKRIEGLVEEGDVAVRP